MGNSRSGVGILFLGWGVFGDATLVWAIVTAPFGVGRLFVVWAIVVPVWGVSFWCGALTIGVGNCDRSGASSSGVGRIPWSPSALLQAN